MFNGDVEIQWSEIWEDCLSSGGTTKSGSVENESQKLYLLRITHVKVNHKTTIDKSKGCMFLSVLGFLFGILNHYNWMNAEFIDCMHVGSSSQTSFSPTNVLEISSGMVRSR